jgi:hypothetical protein
LAEGSPADQAAYSQAFSPPGDCKTEKTFTKFHRVLKAVSVTMNAGNNGYCTFSMYVASGDIPSETITTPPQHGSVKFLPLSGQVVIGYRAAAGYVGADQFDVSFVRADGLPVTIRTEVTVANPAAK